MRKALLCKEHVFGAAKPNTLGAEFSVCNRVSRNIRIRANAEVAAEIIGPFHEFAEIAMFRIRLNSLSLAEVNLAGRAVERNPVAFFKGERLAFGRYANRLLALVDGQLARAHDTRPAHSAGDDCRVA